MQEDNTVYVTDKEMLANTLQHFSPMPTEAEFLEVVNVSLFGNFESFANILRTSEWISDGVESQMGFQKLLEAQDWFFRSAVSGYRNAQLMPVVPMGDDDDEYQFHEDADDDDDDLIPPQPVELAGATISPSEYAKMRAEAGNPIDANADPEDAPEE